MRCVSKMLTHFTLKMLNMKAGALAL